MTRYCPKTRRNTNPLLQLRDFRILDDKIESGETERGGKVQGRR